MMGLVIGIPKEHRPFEYRVGLTPLGVSILTEQGHQCYVESGAGLGSGFTDVKYQQAGARIAYGNEEVFRRADLLLKVQRPTEEEVTWMAEGQIVMAFMLLATAQKSRIKALAEKNITAIAYELIEDEHGALPVQSPLSQIGGRMTAQIAAQYLQNDKGGSGLLLGGIAGIPPAKVVIIGAGTVGMNAARAFLGMGAQVTFLDHTLSKLQIAHDHFGGQVTTMVSYPTNLKRACKSADVVVGAIQVPGYKPPKVVTKDIVKLMHPGALIIDMSIDHGGCVETSRPTQHDQPVFVVEDVIHYCVPNIPGVVGRTATHALLNAAWPFIRQVANEGVDTALDKNLTLQRGAIIQAGVFAG
jgi:alanine dehydrogenase